MSEYIIVYRHQDIVDVFRRPSNIDEVMVFPTARDAVAAVDLMKEAVGTYNFQVVELDK
jgi:hypothetical protein